MTTGKPNGLACAGPGEGGDLQSLLKHNGDRFIMAAYAVLLGREPDPEGLRNFRGRQRDGVSTARILAEIADSPEGRAKGAELPGLHDMLRKMRLASLPLVGAALGSLLRVEGDAPADRHMRALAHQLHELRESALPGLQRVRLSLQRLREAAVPPHEVAQAETWEEQRAQLLAEHAADRKVWAIEQTEAKKFIDSLEERSARAEEYARSLEHERAHWHALQTTEADSRAAAERRVAALEQQLGRLGVDEPMARK